MDFVPGRCPLNDKIVARAQELLKQPATPGWHDNARLRRIIDGKVKSIDVHWWRAENGVAPQQLKTKADKLFKKKLDALTAHTDPARNSNPHERQVAAAALAKLQATGPAKASRTAPGLEDYDRAEAQFRERMDRINARMYEAFEGAAAVHEAIKRNAAAANTTKAKAKASPVNTTKPRAAKPAPVNTATAKPEPPPVNTTNPKPRTADRHREPNRDRHSPGYMRDYMRRRRQKAR
jgi:hypothetical protein